jgi:hypothetical protein
MCARLRTGSQEGSDQVRVDQYTNQENRNLALGKRDCAMLQDVLAKLSEGDPLTPEEQEFTR